LSYLAWRKLATQATTWLAFKVTTDLVSYQTMGKPVRGNGHNVIEYNGVSYQFSSMENKKAFEKNTKKFLPAYGV
jgi:YHS domain-containing protein